ncbi:DUF4349 domain-containing protein [Neobacillus sp. D3-1R]|uniref:DUF4349 domain-containing protein n=1 Tax=Neobacillus sp. D3-1R TaxID=3445778 RepID=UPI003F9FC627
MRKLWIFCLSILLLFLLGACSGQKEEAKMSMDHAKSGSEESISMTENAVGDLKAEETKNLTIESSKRMVIYQAEIRLKVKNYEATHSSLEKKASSYGGYIVQSNVFRDDNKQMSGTITLRIPQDYFQAFLDDAEGVAEEVLERNVNGQDVTEEYVDLESRLRSKRVIEERLLEFMKKANKTEDLLKISSDLARVQEEIEQVLGRMKFLENQTSFSTVTIHLYEDNIIVPDIEKDKLNTWEKTKKQFASSTNFLLSAFSGLFVLVVGNLPILLIISVFLLILYFGFKRYKSNEKTEQKNNEKG